ncbi:hypothetical protein HC248_01530 [Polaromonas vacuolata]|uniref:Uncharacterized protein n=1 Tax=Polaromonas vacuolata TaxID=37448 RepID=A0A6H2H8M9_9BURK|nr:hypothetical protein HC248_01530 [Polaromonas vacuolata]
MLQLVMYFAQLIKLYLSVKKIKTDLFLMQEIESYDIRKTIQTGACIGLKTGLKTLFTNSLRSKSHPLQPSAQYPKAQ